MNFCYDVVLKIKKKYWLAFSQIFNTEFFVYLDVLPHLSYFLIRNNLVLIIECCFERDLLLILIPYLVLLESMNIISIYLYWNAVLNWYWIIIRSIGDCDKLSDSFIINNNYLMFTDPYLIWVKLYGRNGGKS